MKSPRLGGIQVLCQLSPPGAPRRVTLVKVPDYVASSSDKTPAGRGKCLVTAEPGRGSKLPSHFWGASLPVARDPSLGSPLSIPDTPVGRLGPSLRPGVGVGRALFSSVCSAEVGQFLSKSFLSRWAALARSFGSRERTSFCGAPGHLCPLASPDVSFLHPRAGMHPPKGTLGTQQGAASQGLKPLMGPPDSLRLAESPPIRHV